jgi:hypothetical protein
MILKGKTMWPFDPNNQQMYQQYANHWDQGTYAQIPDQEAYQNYRQFVQNAPPPMVQQAHEHYYQQMPQEQRGGLMQGLLGGLMQRGITPQHMGIQNTDPSRMSPQDAARVTGYAQQQQPDLLHQIMGPGGPLGSTGAKLAAAGIAAFAAKQILGGGMKV